MIRSLSRRIKRYLIAIDQWLDQPIEQLLRRARLIKAIDTTVQIPMEIDVLAERSESRGTSRD